MGLTLSQQSSIKKNADMIKLAQAISRNHLIYKDEIWRRIKLAIQATVGSPLISDGNIQIIADLLGYKPKLVTGINEITFDIQRSKMLSAERNAERVRGLL